MSIFSEQAIHKRRARTQERLENLVESQDALVVFCGEPLTKPGGLDQTYPFLPHPTYFWLTGSRRPYGILVFNKDLGWVDFIRPITKEEIIWEGATPQEIFVGQDIKEFDKFLSQNKFSRTFVLGEVPARFQSLISSSPLQKQIQWAVDAARRIKDEEEILLIENLANIANKGYQKVKNILTPGMTERELQIEYEAEVQRHGAHKLPYETIVGSGINAAVLHAIPTEKRIQDNEMVLIDAGADIHDYCVDITRVFSSSGKFTSAQQDLYNIVRKAQEAAIKICKPGQEWHLVHRKAAEVIAEGLKDMKIVKTSADDCVESGAISAFFPHGVGHLVGLRVRDVGYLENEKPRKHYGVTLRVDMKIEEGHVLTVEPGCYFISSLLKSSEIQSQYKDHINWGAVDSWLDIGGVRIEDDILITASGYKNLTAVVEK